MFHRLGAKGVNEVLEKNLDTSRIIWGSYFESFVWSKVIDIEQSNGKIFTAFFKGFS